MPQLDLLTFLPQFTWFAVFFTLFYFRVVTVFLPKIAETLKVRKKVKEQNTRDWTQYEEEARQEAATFERFQKDGFSAAQKAIASDWVALNKETEKVFTHLNHTALTPANEEHLTALYDAVVGEYVVRTFCGQAEN